MKQQTQTENIEWKEEKLGKICDVRDGTHASPKYVSDGYPLITSKNLTKGFIDFSDVNLISKFDFDEINKRSKVDPGDIIMPMIGTIGNPVIVQKIIREFAIKNVALIKFKELNVSRGYIKFILDSPYFDKVTAKYNRGGTQKFIALGDIRNIPIPIPFSKGKPDLKEQERIVSILEKAEKQKERGKKAEELLNEYLKSIFLEMFPNNKFQKLSLRDVADLAMGGTPSTKTKEYWEGGNINWMKSGDIKGDFIKQIPNKITKLGFENSNVRIFPRGTVVIALNGQGRTRGTTAVLNVETTSNQSVVGIMLNKKLALPEYIHYNLKLRYNELRKLTGDDDRSGLNLSILRNLSVLIPPIEIQKEFLYIVNKIEKLKESMHQSNVCSEELFNSLMHKAFRGEL